MGRRLIGRGGEREKSNRRTSGAPGSIFSKLETPKSTLWRRQNRLPGGASKSTSPNWLPPKHRGCTLETSKSTPPSVKIDVPTRQDRCSCFHKSKSMSPSKLSCVFFLLRAFYLSSEASHSRRRHSFRLYAPNLWGVNFPDSHW